MAAVQQRSPTELSDSSEPKDSNFIESMEDEMRRCAEHLERRQSRRRYKSLDRKANGYSSSSYSSSESASGTRSSSSSKSTSVSTAKTLPRSFTLTSEPEEKSVLSPRLILPRPSGGKSPRKSPERSIFKFSNGMDGVFPGQQQHMRDDMDSSPAVSGYHKGSSAPPEISPFISAGSGSCSRENSLTPLQSPLGRTPIGAVAAHSRRSYSSSSPPPAVPPKRHQSSSPPPVPPKPSRNRPNRAKSHTPTSPNRCYMPHKVEVTSIRRNSLTLSPPPPAPMDPELISKLTAKESSEDSKQEHLKFPSADVDLSFHEKVLKAKSLLNDCTGGDGGVERLGPGIESSVDAEDYCTPLRGTPAPPTLGSTSAKIGLTASAKANSSQAEQRNDRRIASSGVNQATTNEAKANVQKWDPSEAALLPKDLCSLSSEAEPLPQGNESSVDTAPDKLDSANCEDATNKGTASDPSFSDLSLGDPSSCPSNSDPYVSDPSVRDSELSVDDQTSIVEKEVQETAADGVVSSTKSREDGKMLGHGGKVMDTEVVEVEQKVDEKLSDELQILSTQPKLEESVTISPQSKSSRDDGEPSEQHESRRDSMKAKALEDTEHLSTQLEVGDGGDAQPLAVFTGSTEASEPEIKSIPLQSCRTTSKHGSQRTHQGRKNSKNSEVVKPEDEAAACDTPNKSGPRSPNKLVTSSMDKPGTGTDSEVVKMADKQLSLESVGLEGVGESVALLIKGLQIKFREKEEDMARLQRQKERELKERDEKLKNLTREAKKIEKDKWELLKRARDAAERSLHLRTQLDIKEGSLRSVQGELDRTRDELVSVKSANTSLRALLSDLRGSRPSTADVSVQVEPELISGSLRRNRSIELAFTQGGLSQEQESGGGIERTADNRMSSSSLGLHWQERWERDVISVDSASLQDEGRDTPLLMGGGSQPLGSRESRRSRKKGALLSRMMRSSGGKRGSRTSITSTGEGGREDGDLCA